MKLRAYQRWYGRLVWRVQRLGSVEGYASAQAIRQHNILQLLDEHLETVAPTQPHTDMFMDRLSIATVLGITPKEVLDELMVLTQADLVHPETFDDATGEVYILTRPGKAALVSKRLLTESAHEHWGFVSNLAAIAFSALALIVSIISLFQSC